MIGCEKLPITPFEIISGDEIIVDIPDLGTEQKCLAEMHRAVTTGFVNESLSHRDPGNNLSRWLTIANRILRLYVSTHEPTSQLIVIVEYIVKLFFPTWFDIKRYTNITDGAVNQFKMISRSQSLHDDETKRVVQPVIKRNAYFCHPENILIAMVNDDSYVIRRLAWKMNLKARLESRSRSQLRVFMIPELDFNAKSYYEIISWSEALITQPPLMRAISDQKLKEYAETDTPDKFDDLLKLPCHTQAVERHVKLVMGLS